MNFDFDWGRWVFGYHAPHVYLGPLRWTPANRLPEPVFGSGGRPTAQTLLTISCWEHRGPSELFRFIQEAWHPPEYFAYVGDGVFEVSTGGWSGNEDLIEALHANTAVWMLCFKSSQAGGHYTFQVPDYEEAQAI